DGEENYSQEFTLKEVKLIIEQLSAKRNWAFGLIGAGIDVEKTAMNLSIPLKRTLTFRHEKKSVNRMFARYAKAQKNLHQIIDKGGLSDELPF
ncbi:MAG: hypothetical protein GY699_18970, partial [Desulfobacteraceae bacterium]|nr:hypothetical protein [Desulfobacteraceae bacterium]